MDRTLHVPRELDGFTIAAALRNWLPEKSWAEVQRLVAARHVLIDGNLCTDKARRIKAGNVVKLLAHSTAPPPREQDVRIVYLDEHLVVVDKPSGLTTVRHAEERNWPQRRRQIQPTLEDLLPRIIAKRGSGAARQSKRARGKPTPTRTTPVRPVHRIDRDTSGLIVFARTARAERLLQQQFKQHTTYRRYQALVRGTIEKQTVQSRLVRDRGDGRRGSTSEPEVGKEAITHVTPLEHLGDYTLVQCRLETGRTHQIRIHLAEQGHPVCGEKIYHQPLFKKPTVDRSGAPRLMLHAAELGFEHPITGEQLKFTTTLPPDMQSLVKRLRKRMES